MSSILRRSAVILSSLVLAFFCSCERHKASELLAETEHAKPGEAGAHGAEHAAPSASPMGTPAQFFPAASPSPR